MSQHEGGKLMLTPEQERWMDFRIDVARSAIASVKQKLEDGTYPLESTKCFCGADDDQELRTKDRFGLPHRVVVCKHCAVVRANPRPTAESYYKFYNDEYRRFLYRWLDRPAQNWEEEYQIIIEKQQRTGRRIHDLMVCEDIEFPKVVVDIGCYLGGVLDHFKEHGAETWGVEFNAEARQRATARGHKMVSSVKELIAAGVKADFIIMQDVIEHYLDLGEVWHLRNVLQPEGYLYVYTPGLFRSDPQLYWQLAHTWYFVANTLKWVMDLMGFVPTYLDEDISSFWRFEGPPVNIPNPPVEWVEYIVDEAEGKEERRLPPFNGICKFTKKLLYDNMRRNFAMKFPDVGALEHSQSGSIVVIGGGPSIDSEVEKILTLKYQGAKVIAIARMYPWCIEHGITPDYVVSLDCSEEQEKGFAMISPYTKHLMASVTRPEILEMIHAKGAPIYLFDSRDDRKIKKLRREAGYETCFVVNAGGTVVITAINLSLLLGFTDYHIFGLDLMIPDAQHTHAEGIAGVSVDQHLLPVDIDGEQVFTTPSFIEFARQALDVFSAGHEQGMLKTVKIYGESIINKMWDSTWHEEAA